MKTSAETRRRIISEYKLNKDLTGKHMMEMYFGLVDQQGNVDERYPNTIDIIAKSLDNCIHFSYTIASDLHKYGCKLAQAYGKNAPQIVGIKLPKELLDKNLMPDEKNYSSWVEGFETEND
ncbi:MAG: hypothetical protein V7727_19200 [Sneathiella sp.]